jgi:hypothetical protein
MPVVFGAMQFEIETHHDPLAFPQFMVRPDLVLDAVPGNQIAKRLLIRRYMTLVAAGKSLPA